MPQTVEHLGILNLLGIEQGIIAITMCDLADEEDIELILEEVEELVEGTFLEGAPIIQTSAKTPFGQTELTQALLELPNRSLNPSNSLPFRLPVDRSFSQKGFGTVVTGTSRGTHINVGDGVQIVPQGLSSRIRDIQHGHDHHQTVQGGLRVALNLSSVATQDIPRGSIVIPSDAYVLTQMVDISYTSLPNAPEIEDGTRVRLLFGASEALGKCVVLDSEAHPNTRFVQIRLDTPHLLCRGDRCIVRWESPLITLGGGVVLDPYAPKIRQKNKSEQFDWLMRIKDGDNSALLERVGFQSRTIKEATLLNVTGTQLGQHVYADVTIASLLNKIDEFILNWHQQHPLKSGLSVGVLQSAIPFLSKDAIQHLSTLALERGRLQVKKGLLHHHTFAVTLNPAQQTEIDKILQQLKAAGLEGLALNTFKDVPTEIIGYLLDNALVIRVQTQLLHPQPLQHLTQQLSEFFQDNAELSTTDFKTITQLSRKFSIPLLEWMDENQKTLRRGDTRLAGPSLLKELE
jgi:selenocysteine-specific elongation factor